MPLPIIPTGLEAEANDVRTALLALDQAGIRTAQGRYLQALAQPSTLPAEGIAATVDAAVTRPADRTTSLGDHGVTYGASSRRIQTAIHEYLGPAGAGWTIVQRVRAGGVIWRRVTHEAGPETWRVRDWATET